MKNARSRDGCGEGALRIGDDDPIDVVDEKHRGIIPGVSRDRDPVEVDSQGFREPGDRVSLVGFQGENIEVASRGIHDLDLEASAIQSLLEAIDVLPRLSMPEPTRLEGILALFRLLLDLLRLVGNEGFHSRYIPTRSERRGPVLQQLSGFGMENLGAHSSNEVVGRREVGLGDQLEGVLDGAPRVVGQEWRRRAASQAAPEVGKSSGTVRPVVDGSVDVGRK